MKGELYERRQEKGTDYKISREFSKLNEDNKMFILGYMFGIQQERQRADRKQPQTA